LLLSAVLHAAAPLLPRAHAAGMPYSNRLTSPARGRPAANPPQQRAAGEWWDRRTDVSRVA